MIRPRGFLAAAFALATCSGIASAQSAAERTPSGTVLRTFDTPYYVLHTDLGPADEMEADLRITRMFEEYKQRTTAFSGQIKEKFPFYLYQNEVDYLAAGGPKGSAGVFIQSSQGSRLMAVAGERTSAETWHVVQHEGFHQFVAAAIKGEIPIWANEGLAEYFGESLWTGDGFVVGLIPNSRLTEMRTAIRASTFKPFTKIMTMTDTEWGDRLEYSNYTEAWAMVHFLLHAEGGRYQPGFMSYITQISKGTNAQAAWKNVYGPDIQGFENRFAQWWMSLPDQPTRVGYMQAMVQTETSFYARACILNQRAPDIHEFLDKYQPPEAGLNRDLWLPPSLFESYASTAQEAGTWSQETAGNATRLICKEDDGTKYVATFGINGKKVAGVAVQVIPPPDAQRAAPGRGN